MEIFKLTTNPLNQNSYSKNLLTPEFIGSLLIYPVNCIPDNCLSCDGYILKIEDYKLLYSVIGTQFNSGTEAEGEFRIPDYNITGRFLQPGTNVGTQIAAGLPDHTHTITAFYWNASGIAEEGRGNPDYGHQKTLTSSKASASNPIYGKSSTVQPPSQVVKVCIRYK